MKKIDVLVIGAGAAGLMCAIEAGKRQRKITVIDHANKPGKKILMSGGGRCNFTNYNIHPDCYISHNPHFCISALKRYTQWDFIDLVKQYKIPFHEKTLGQLFCDHKSQAILEMLMAECEKVNVDIQLYTSIESIEKVSDYHFRIKTNHASYHCESLVIACGGLSIPTMGASPFGYHIAKQFDISVWPVKAALVPLTLHANDKEKYATLSGVSVESDVSCGDISFRENILFTHRGLSGPAVLQISSYWQPGDALHINLLPDLNFSEFFESLSSNDKQKLLKNILHEFLPKRLIEIFIPPSLADKKIIALTDIDRLMIAKLLQTWEIKPNGTEGYRTAEVTLGGVDCNALSSKTMEVNNVPGLYFIGEVVDVTGWLGGYNFQWAWSSGWAAGQVV